MKRLPLVLLSWVLLPGIALTAPAPQPPAAAETAPQTLTPAQALRSLDSLNFFNSDNSRFADEETFKEIAARFRQQVAAWEKNPDTCNGYPWVAELLNIAYQSNTAFLIRPDILRCFIAITTDINAEDAYGYTAMDYAVRVPIPYLFQQLLAAGAKANTTRRDDSDQTALFHAVSTGNKHATEYLLQQGSYVNDFNSEGNSVLSFALSQGHLDIVDILLAASAKLDPYWEDDSGYTLLHDAAGGGCTEIVRQLILNGADISAETSDGVALTPLMIAVLDEHPAAVLELLKHRPNLRQQSESGSTVLQHAITVNSPVFPQLFQEAKKQKILTENLLSAHLKQAMDKEASEIASFLIQNGAGFDVEQHGWQYLGVALRRGDAQLLRLLEAAGAQFDACTPDDDGVTQLMLAAEYGDPELVEQFLMDCADVHAADNEGTSVITYALRGGNEHVIELLLDAGAKLSPQARTAEGETQLMLAARNGLESEVRDLLRLGAHLSAYSESGKNALMEALENGHVRIVKLLVQNGARLTPQHKTGQHTLLMSAAQGGLTNYIQALLLTGHRPNDVLFPASDADTPAGTTALMIAAQHGHEKIVRLLINAGAFPHLCNEDGQTAADLARENGHTALADYLQSLP